MGQPGGQQWRRRFGTPLIARTQVAGACPGRGLVVTNRSGTFQLYAWEVDSGALRQLTERPAGTIHGVIEPSGGRVFFLDDPSGGERGHWTAVPWAGGAGTSLTPQLAPYRSSQLSFARVSGAAAFCGDGRWLWCAGTVTRFPYLVECPVLEDIGQVVVLAAATAHGYPDTLLAVAAGSGEVLARLADDGALLQPVAFRHGRVLAATDRTGDVRPLLWRPADGAVRRVDAGLPGDVVPLDWSPDGRRLLLLQTHRGIQRLHEYHLGTGRTRRTGDRSGSYGHSISFSADPGGYYHPRTGEVFALWQDGTHPPRLLTLGGPSGAVRRVVLPAGSPPRSHRWRSVTFTSADGTPVQGWLLTPRGNGPWPAVVHLRGGPHLVTTESWLPAAQAWADHGFAFLTINYRGSTSFGRDFQEQIVGRQGELEVTDAAAGRDWLVANGLARPDQVALTGWSYGGYLTLLALGRCPDLWAAGIAAVAVADLQATYQQTTEQSRAFMRRMLGGTPHECPHAYATASPLSYAAAVRVPILVIQGRHDPRCPPGQMQGYLSVMRDLGKAIDVEWIEHGHVGPRASAEHAAQVQDRQIQFIQSALATP
ncbi:MAG TPA: prolyl oligopeptidase family serine peptidase [Streptosporangiaceae bacterium]|nr:prolyl oligopeptidase family serine peptidase [Streptosporangiaceae bacterium]